MNKKLGVAALCACMAISSFAQESTVTEKVEYSTDKYKVETNPFSSNWFITVGAGGQVYFGDHDRQVDFNKRLSPALDIAVGKWFTPGIGVRFVYSGLNQRGATRKDWANEMNHQTGEEVPGWDGGLQYEKFNFFNLHADVLFNLSNLFCGYNENRIWNSSLYGGLGWMRTWDAPTCGDISMNFGWLNTFRLNKAWDANVDFRSTMVNDRFDGELGDSKHDGLVTLTVGLTYKFKPRGWNRSKTVIRYDYGDLESMRAKLNEMSAENERLKKAVAEGNVSNARVIIKKIAAGNLVVFQIGKSKLSKEARANLGMLASIIKDGDQETMYTITGYADAGTGSKKSNEKLSQKRAEAVYDCLVNEFGVNKSQLRIDYKGGVENMFYDDPRLSRAVITRGE